MKTFNLYLSIVMTLLLAGCGSPPSSSYLMPQQIGDPVITLLPPAYEYQTERINNCDGASPNYLVSYKTVESQNATFQVVVEAGGLITGTPIPAALEVQLEAKINAALSKQYGITVERDHQLQIEIPNGKKVEHVITWKVTRVEGLIDVFYQNETAQVAFNRIANVELFDRQSQELSCDENVNLITPEILSPLPQDTPVVIGTTPPPSPNSFTTSEIASELDTIFQSGNWFCFPDRGDAIAVRKLPEVTIQSPVVKVDTYLGTYTSGKTPYGIGATIWLNTWVSQENCPAFQLSSFTDWKSADMEDNNSFDKARMNALFGAGNWQCVPSFPYAVKVLNLPAGTSIQYPFTAVDNSSGRYGVGESMPQSGSATVWLAGSIPQNDCP